MILIFLFSTVEPDLNAVKPRLTKHVPHEDNESKSRPIQQKVTKPPKRNVTSSTTSILNPCLFVIDFLFIKMPGWLLC